MILSDVCLSVCLSLAYIGPKSRTERPRKSKIGTEVAHVACDSDSTFTAKRSKVKVTQAALVGLYWQANMDIELVTDTDACSKMYVYRGTTCRPGRGRIVAASYLQLVKLTDWGDYIERLCTENMHISYSNNNNNNNTSICKAHNVSIRAESEAPAVARWRGWLEG